MTSVLVVIPTVRQLLAEYVQHLPADIELLVVNDGTGEVPLVHPRMRVFSLEEQRHIMGADYDLIPRATSACRNFGFYYALKYTDATRILSFDDDVRLPVDTLESYADLGQTRTVETVTGPAWLNTIDLLKDVTPGRWYPRGFPYDQRGRESPVTRGTTTARVVCRMGLWSGMLDTHALDKVLFEDYRCPVESPDVTRPTIRVGTANLPMKFPLCSMNFGASRDALPALYQWPMRPSIADRFSLWRYEDIWAGYLFQTLADLRDDAVVVGRPVVVHQKASDLARELSGEHFGLLMSPSLYALIDEASTRVRPAAYAEMMSALADVVLTHGPGWRRQGRVPSVFWDYYASVFGQLQRWASLCTA